MNVLVIQNNPQTPVSLVGDYLVAAGAKLATILMLARWLAAKPPPDCE